MQRIALTLALALAAAPLAHAELYKYVDKDGKTVYSDAPPPNADTRQLKTLGSAPPAAAPKTAMDKDKDQEKLRKEAREKQDKADKAARGAEEQERACNQARANQRAVQQGGRLYKYDEKGERAFMTDDEIEAEKAKAARAVDEACKKG